MAWSDGFDIYSSTTATAASFLFSLFPLAGCIGRFGEAGYASDILDVVLFLGSPWLVPSMMGDRWPGDVGHASQTDSQAAS